MHIMIMHAAFMVHAVLVKSLETFLMFLKRRLFCSSSLYLFDQNINCNKKKISWFLLWIYSKM